MTREEYTMQFEAWIENTKGKKIVLTDHIRNGQSLLRKFNIGQEKDCCQVSFMTIQQVAKELLFAWNAFEETTEAETVLEPESCVYVLDEIIRDGSYYFVPSDCFCIQTTEEILKSLNQIRMNESKQEYWNSDERKIKELQQLIACYETKLESEHAYDMPLLLKKAIWILKQLKEKEELYLYLPWMKQCQIGYLEDFELTAQENCFLKELLIISGQSVQKLQFYTETMQTDVNYRFFSAYGIVNEIRYVIEDMLNKNRRYDEVNVFYSSPVYEHFIRGAFESRGIPCRFLTGESVSANFLVQFLTAVLEFAREDFLYERLSTVIENPLMSFQRLLDENKDAKDNPLTCYNHFIRKGIGWGKERYLQCIEREREKEESKIKYQYYLEFLKDLINVFEEEHSCGVLYRRLLAFASKYTNSKNKQRNRTISVLREQGTVLEQIAEQKTQADCIRLIEEYLKTMKLQTEKDEMAEVHVMRIQNLEVLERPYQYVIGLSAKQFQTDTIESPVLTDEELQRYLSGKLTLATEAGKKVYENLELTFATLSKGEIVLGYSTFDTIELKESSPSVFYLNFLEEYGNGCVEAHCECSVLNEAIKISDDEDGAGVHAHSPQKEVALSPSALQTLIGCPLHYHYQYEEYLPNREFQKKMESCWLNPANRGNLFHRTMEAYCKEVLWQKEIGNLEPDREAFERIYQNAVQEMLEIQPFTSWEVYQREVEENEQLIWAYLQEFYAELKVAYKNGKKWRILGCELAFEKIAQLIDAPEGEEGMKLLFKGSIDRLDAYLGEDSCLYLRVVDYKTGKHSKLKKAVKDKEQIQHVAYALAAKSYVSECKEQLQDLFDETFEKVEVETAQYVFPHESGAERILDVVKDKSLKLETTPLELPKEVHDIAWRVFMKGDYSKENPNCDYCTYKRQCREKLGTEL